MHEFRITYMCELLEDLHSGSGQGRLGLVDDTQARDSQGRPVVWSTTLSGVLRDAADELRELEHALASEDRIRRLFGCEGEDGRSSLVMRSWHFSRPAGALADEDGFCLAESTAREVHSRRPLEQTLRTIEMASAGQSAQGELRFRGTTEDLKFVQLCLSRLTNVGGGKTRGQGQVRITDSRVDQREQPASPVPPPGGRLRLRLLLHLLEPVCIPATGFPGNVIPCESYLPGTTLRGAWLTAMSDSGVQEAEVSRIADARAVQFGNGYFVDAKLLRGDVGLHSLLSMPLPLTAEEAKSTEQPYLPTGTDWLDQAPWWAHQDQALRPWLSDPGIQRDRLGPQVPDVPNAPAPPADSVKFKRVKSEEYLVSADGGETFYRTRPAVLTLLRNRSPVRRLGRVKDSRRPTADPKSLEEAGDLFATTVLAENQFFVAEVRFGSEEIARLFVQHAELLLPSQGQSQTPGWLRLGRGGRPIVVEKYEWLPDSPCAPLPDAACEFTLMLTSDLIVRDNDLTFHTTLDEDSLASLAGIAVPKGRITINREHSVDETRTVRGFNTAAGTFRSPAIAIKRGSAYLVNSADPASLRSLYNAISDREAKGLGCGERTEEGFGRMVLNHPAHRKPPQWVESQTATLRKTLTSTTRQSRETAIAFVLRAVGEMDLAKSVGKAQFPGRSQWQWLRHAAELLGRPGQSQTAAQLLGTIKNKAELLSGHAWKPWIPGIQKYVEQLSDRGQQRTFLIYLAKWAVLKLDDERKSRGSGKDDAREHSPRSVQL